MRFLGWDSEHRRSNSMAPASGFSHRLKKGSILAGEHS